ncbi:hypothetical protein B0A48_06141 [Cryoendolithus antarcticus]|uniref:Linoleate 8R-lipoxygenase n=1 Tax=Cryoendolithus antarcticus TaxID=1507870 RepID=A0A1V8TAK0_9PEZI|nr:hypothetical protein B0A48_06141 [Cryoendolithus antarcticus]
MSHAIHHALRNAPTNRPYAPWIHHLQDKWLSTRPFQDEVKPTSRLELEVEAEDNAPPIRVAGQATIIKETVTGTKAADFAPPNPVALGEQPAARDELSKIDKTRRVPDQDDIPAMSQSNGSSSNPNDDGPPEPEISLFEELKAKASGSLLDLKTLLKAIKAPLPTETGDGSELNEQAHIDSLADKFANVCKDLVSEGFTLPKLLEAGAAMAGGKMVNDKDYHMEALVEAAAKLPDDFTGGKITDQFVTTLWNDLAHPPQTLLGDEYQFRQPDGSKNSYQNPQIGAAGMPYARTVAPKTLQSGTLPDPGVLFDTLMARKKTQEHPNRISSMLFYLASIIIHDVFRTDHEDYRKSDTSSYLDLAPLYGSRWEDQKRMRTFKDGKIIPDCFSETRLLSFPPGVGCILIMFNRYHNYVVEQLASINEGGRFDLSEKTVERYGETLNKREDDLFQTGRLIVCGLYVNMILIDYVRTILNLNRTDSNWQLNPRKDIPGLAQGTGNQVSAEFNLVYRWHASVSARDEKWTEELSAQMWAGTGKNMNEVPQYEIIQKLGGIEATNQALEPNQRQFPALDSEKFERIKEGPYKGYFKDDDIAAILTGSIEDCANAMGPQQIPIVLRAVEILGIQQARTWQLATLNEFRKHFKLEPHKKFSDITKNVEVAEALKHLYDTPDNVELYPGLVVEDAKDPKLPGSGLCPSFTTSRGVLSDAVALVRGDRFYTTSYTPASLTNWGYKEASSDLAIDNGCVWYRLFMRTLPNNYDPSSVYVHYPMTIPGEMHKVLKDLHKDHKYSFERPAPIKQPVLIFSYETATKVMENQELFKVTWGKAIEFLMGPKGKDFMLAGDDTANADSRKLMEKALYRGGSSRGIPEGNETWLTAVKTYYENITTELLKQHSYKLGKLNQVDIIRDVGNMAHVHFSADLFGLPLKTEKFPHGIFTEKQLYLVMAAVFICVFFDVDPAKSFPLRQSAYEATQKLGQVLELEVGAIAKGGALAESIISRVHPSESPALKDYGAHMIAQLLKTDSDVKSLVWGNIIGTCGGMVANQGQLFGQALDYLFTEGQEHIPAVADLAKQDTPEAFDKLMHYFMEFSRLNGETGVFRYVTQATSLTDNGIKYDLKPGDKIMVNLKSASRDPAVFGTKGRDPNKVNTALDTPLDAYIHLGYGPHQCLGLPMVRVALTTMLKTIFKACPKLRPATVAIGRQSVSSSVKKVLKEFQPGDLAKIPEGWHFHAYLTEDWDMFFPFPTSLKVNWD